MYINIPTKVTAKAPLSVIMPEGSSLPAVLGFLLSISRSMILFRPSAAVLAPIPARRISISIFNLGTPLAAKKAPDNIKGSEKRVCSTCIKLPYDFSRSMEDGILPDLGYLLRIRSVFILHSYIDKNLKFAYIINLVTQLSGLHPTFTSPSVGDELRPSPFMRKSEVTACRLMPRYLLVLFSSHKS